MNNKLTNKNKYITVVFIIAVIIFFIIIIVNQKKRPSVNCQTLFAFDTVMELSIYDADESSSKDLLKEMSDIIYDLEKKFSVTIDDSDISKLNSSDGEEVTVSDETYELLETAIDIAKETDGLFDPSVYPIVKLWGFTTDIQHVPNSGDIKTTLESVGYNRIHILGDNRVKLDEGTKVDLGACAKGYLSDKLCEVMKNAGVSGIVSLGGNVQSVGTKSGGEPFKVGITDPSDGQSIYTTVESSDNAVITSGDYQRYFEENGKRYHHIFDVRTGYPAESSLSSVTVIGPKGVYCDAYATAMFVMGEDDAVSFMDAHPDYSVIFIRQDGSYRKYPTES